MARKKILIIDDEPDIRDMVSVRLMANGYDVVTASDGEEGLKQVESQKPDLIIVDITMPGIDGYTFVKILKKDIPAARKIPIIVLTGKDRMEDLFKIEGVGDYLVKPYESSQLLEKIKKHLYE